MVVPARDALSSIEQAILGARRDEDRLTTMLRSATDEMAQLRARQAEAYKALARLKLDALARDQVVGELDSAERQAVEALARRKDALAGLAAARKKLVEAMSAADKARSEAQARLAAALDKVEDLTEATKARLEKDADAAATEAKVEAAEATAAAAAEKAAQAEKDRAEKGKPYEADSLFMYLWKRGYGTSAYRGGPIARYFDAKVARIVGYDTARPNYFMLNEIPLRLREHATRLEAAAEAARAERTAFERAALEADGIVRLEAEADKVEEAVTAADKAAEDLKAKLAASDKEQATALDEASDQSLARAVDGLAQAIAREDLASLYKEAMATPTPEDEKIVASLRDIEGTLTRRSAEAEEVRKAAVELARKRTELEHSRDRFRTSGYDDPRGEFINGAVIGGIIGQILAGALNSGALDDALKSGFSRRAPRGGGSFGGGLRFPGGGGGSMPRMPSPPRMPKGGFRTGGRF